MSPALTWKICIFKTQFPSPLSHLQVAVYLVMLQRYHLQLICKVQFFWCSCIIIVHFLVKTFTKSTIQKKNKCCLLFLLPDLSFQSKFEIALNYSWIVSLQQQNKALVILYKILLWKKILSFIWLHQWHVFYSCVWQYFHHFLHCFLLTLLFSTFG